MEGRIDSITYSDAKSHGASKESIMARLFG
jgi:hypothetical protein